MIFFHKNKQHGKSPDYLYETIKALPLLAIMLCNMARAKKKSFTFF